jgi:hypothetical protein
MPINDVKRIQRRAKESERALARWLIRHDGLDPLYRLVASSTGRIGHLTGLQFDVASKTYDAENKNMVVPAGLWKAWQQVCRLAKEHGKEPLLRLEPSNTDKKGVPILHIITEERHRDLLIAEANGGHAIDILDDLPVGLSDLDPDWDWEEGRPHG